MVVRPPFTWPLQVATLYPFFSYTANSGSAAFLWVLFSHMVQNLRDGVTPAGSRLVLSSIGTKVWSGYYVHCCLILSNGVTLWVEPVLGLILDRNEEFSDFLWVVPALRGGITL